MTRLHAIAAVAIGAGENLRERITALRELDRHVLGRLVESVGIVDRTGFRDQQRPQCLGRDVLQIRNEIELAEPIRLALVDRENDDEAVACRIVFGGRGHDLHVLVTFAHIKSSQQIPVGFDAIRIVDIAPF